MTDMKLTVLTHLRNAEWAALFDGAGFPEGVQGRVAAYDGGAPAVEAGGAALLITDDADVLDAAGRAASDRLYRVFVGDPAKLPSGLDGLEDVWNPAEGGALLRQRYLRLLAALKTRFDAAFYRSTLLTTIDTIPDMLWYKRIDGIHMLVNDAFTEIVHKPKSDVVGKDHFYIWDAPRPAEGNDFACAESEEIAISTGRTYICDEPVKTREGMKQFTTYKTPVYDPFGNVFGTVGVGHDVTNFSNLGIELSILIENMPFPMTIFTPDWEVVRMNTHFMEIVGIRDTAGFDYRRWKAGVPVPVGDVQVDGGRHAVSREYRIGEGDGARSILLMELEIRDSFDNISGYFCTMRDITYQRAYEASILRAANTDVLTGMRNRRYIYDYLTANLGRPLRFVYLDLDRFKAVNDRYGHSVGDEVLVATSRLIDAHFPDAVTARLGGDEFAVVDETHSLEEVERACQALKAAVEAEFRKYDCGTTISAGIACSDGTAVDIDKLIRESDVGMYAEKSLHHAGKY